MTSTSTSTTSTSTSTTSTSTVTSTTSPPIDIICENFDDGDYVDWTAVTNNGTVLVTTENPFQGTHSLESAVTGTPTGQAYIYKIITNRDFLGIQGAVYVDTPIYSSKKCWFLAIGDGTTKLAAFGFINTVLVADQHRQTIRLGWYDNGVWNETISADVDVEKWLRFSIVFDRKNNSIHWWADDWNCHNEVNLNFDDHYANRISVGIQDSDFNHSYKMWLDNVCYDDATPCVGDLCLYINWRDQITAECGWTRIGSKPYLDYEDYPVNYIKSNVPNQWSCDYRFEDTLITGYPVAVNLQIKCKDAILGDDTFEAYIWDGNDWNFVGEINPVLAMQWFTIDITAVLNTFDKINEAKIKLKYKEV